MAQSERSLQVSKLKGYLDRDDIRERFFDVMSKQQALQYISTIINEYSNNQSLLKCTPKSVIGASLVSASLDLPINSNLGFAYLVPYKNHKKGTYEAQFQMGYKGYVQLALRTGRYEKINVTEVYDNQLTSFNRLTEELDADFSKAGEGEVVGYAGYLKLVTGFEKVVYWTKDEVEKHAKRYSQAYKSKYKSPWDDDYKSMALKTVLKDMIKKWGIMTTEMDIAQTQDQKVFGDIGESNYLDNPESDDAERPKTKAEEEFEKARKEAEDVEEKSVEDDSDLEGTPFD